MTHEKLTDEGSGHKSVLDADPPCLVVVVVVVVGGEGCYTRHHLFNEPHGENLLALKI